MLELISGSSLMPAMTTETSSRSQHQKQSDVRNPKHRFLSLPIRQFRNRLPAAGPADIHFVGFAGCGGFCSLVGGTMFFSRMYVTRLP